MSNLPEERCPKCGSYDIEWIESQSYPDDDFIHLEWRCECYDCHTKFRIDTTYRAVWREIETEKTN